MCSPRRGSARRFLAVNPRLMTVYSTARLKYRIQAPLDPRRWVGGRQHQCWPPDLLHAVARLDRHGVTRRAEAVVLVACEMMADGGAVSGTAVRLRVGGRRRRRDSCGGERGSALLLAVSVVTVLTS